ncbi:MAG TPA: hypothetical protein VGL56_00200 [Fimbriimonadaceae bacterium]|jgi:hypothetical protein
MLLKNTSRWLRQCFAAVLPLLLVSAINHHHKDGQDADHCVICTSIGAVRKRELPSALLPECSVAGGPPDENQEAYVLRLNAPTQAPDWVLTGQTGAETICLPQVAEPPTAGVFFGGSAFALPIQARNLDSVIDIRESTFENSQLVPRRAPPTRIRPRGPPLI